MGITIKQRGEKWRIELSNEIWEFDNREKLEDKLKFILDLKEDYGKINEKY